MERISDVLERFKWPVLASVVGLVLIGGGMLRGDHSENKPQVQGDRSYLIKVDVSGAVLKAGVYSLNSSSRVEDAISQAGGFLKEADTKYISKHLNLSQKLSDGQKIYIPFQGEEPGSGSAGGGMENKISINSASNSDLEKLPSIGPASASKIVSGRPYQELYDLVSKRVISRSVYEQIKELIQL